MSHTAQQDDTESRQRLERARQCVDQFVRRWETFTAEWDDQPFACELCQQREGRDATLFCDTGKYLPGQYNDTFWVCDECLGDRDAPGLNRSLVFRRIERDQPHVWSGSLQNDHRNGLLASAPWPGNAFGRHGPWAAFVGINIASAPSLRAWLPLCGHVALGLGGMGGDDDEDDDDEDIVLVPLVCCDAESDAWGCVVVVEFFMYGSMSRWTRLAGSLEDLARESSADATKRYWQARISGAADADAGPLPKPVPFNQTHLASIITGTDMFAAITGASPRDSYPW